MGSASHRSASGGRGTVAMAVVLSIFCCFLYASPLLAADWFVRSSGDDTADGLSPATAVATIGQAASMVSPGDRVVVGPGIYAEGEITPAAFGFVTFFADRLGLKVGEAPGDVVVDATGFPTGFELNGNIASRIDGFVVYGSGIGIYVKSASDHAQVTNNIVSNCNSHGIWVQDAKNAYVFNNLVYNNDSSGILLRGNVSGSPGARVVNNTVYGNADRGIFFGGTDIDSAGGLVLNNIIAENRIGLQVNETSIEGYLGASNLLWENRPSPEALRDYASGTPVDPTDQIADPLFVDPAGRNGFLGGAGYEDDSFHLSNRRTGESTTSPAVNAGNDYSRRLRLSRASTRSDAKVDHGLVDLGFHYANYSRAPRLPDRRLRYRPRYVSADAGDDANDGFTRDSPMRSIERALADVKAGEEIIILGGEYREGMPCTPPEGEPAIEGGLILSKSGKPGREIRIRGVNGAKIDATGFCHGLIISEASYIRVVGLEISNAIDDGLEIRNESSEITLRHLRLVNNAKRGLHVNRDSAVDAGALHVASNGTRGIHISASTFKLNNSRVENNVDQGLWIEIASDVKISASRILSNGKDGILSDGSTVEINRCTVRGGSDGTIRFREQSTGRLYQVNALDSPDVGVQAISSNVTITGGQISNHGRVGVEAVVGLDQPMSMLKVSAARVCNNGTGARVEQSLAEFHNVTFCTNEMEGVVHRGESLKMTRCTIEGNGARGVNATEMTAVDLDQVSILDNAKGGALFEAEIVTLNNSTVSDNKEEGVLVLPGSALTGSDNAIERNEVFGVLAQQSSVTLEDTVIDSSGDVGLRLSDGAVGNIAGGRYSANGNVGIQAIKSSLAIAGATIEKNQRGGVESTSIVEAPGPLITPRGLPDQLNTLMIDNAMICLNAGAGIIARDAAVSLNDVELCQNAENGLTQRNGTIEAGGLNANDNQADGLNVMGVSEFKLLQGEVLRNEMTGIVLLDVRYALLDGVELRFNKMGALLSDASQIVGPRSLDLSNSMLCDNPSIGLDLRGGLTTLAGVTVCMNSDVGIRQEQGTLHGTDLIVTGNQAEGIVTIDGVVALERANISSNRVLGLRTVALLGGSGSQLSLSESRVCDNIGDGISTDTTNTTVVDTEICDNTASGWDHRDGSLSLTRSVVSGNGNDGLVADSEVVELVGSTLASNGGHGLSAMQTLSLRCEDSTFSSNSLTGFRVFGIGSMGSQLTLIQSTLCQNGAHGVDVNDADLSFDTGMACDNSEAGIRVERGAFDGRMLSLSGNGKEGIHTVGSIEFSLIDSTVQGNGDKGVEILDGVKVSLNELGVLDNQGTGIDVIASLLAPPGSVLVGSSLRIRRNQGLGISVEGLDVVLSESETCSSSDVGIRVRQGSFTGSSLGITDNGGEGIQVSDAGSFSLSDSIIGANGRNGVEVARSGSFSMRDSVAYSNDGDGINVLDAPGPVVWNSLVYDNSSTGLLISGDIDGSPNALVAGSTFFSNANRGILIGGSDEKPPSVGAVVLRNIFHQNGNAGLQINQTSRVGTMADYNLSTDPYGAATPSGRHDILADPQFVDPDGADGVMGGSGAEDDQFHLSHRASGQNVSSPAIDAGDISVSAAVMSTMSTRLDGVLDSGIVDLGFHYRPTQ